MRGNKKIIEKIPIFIFVIFACAWSVFPVLYLIMISFTGIGALPINFALPRRFTLNNWQTILLIRPMWPYMVRSLIVAGVVIVVTLIVSLPASYSFSRHQTKFNTAFFNMFLIFRMIPWISLALPIFFMLKRYHLLGTLLGVSLAHLICTIPLSIWLLKGFFDMMPREVEEAALVDGANLFQVLRLIVLPLSRPGIAVATLFTFLFSYIEFLYALIITKAQTFTLPVYLASLVTTHETYWRLIACSALFSLVPMIIIFTFLQKHLKEGFALGGTK